MGIKGQDAISCRGGLGLHVTRGEKRIKEMESHLKCMRDKLFMLETMLPGPVVTSMKNQEGEPENGGQEDNCKCDYANLVDKKEGGEEMCVLKTLSTKEKKLREEIFHMECKEKKYRNILLNVKVNQNDKEEIQKPEDDLPDLARADNSFPTSWKGESSVKEKISQLEEYSKKLCYCLRSIQNNRREWSHEAEYLSKELNGFDNHRGLDDFLGFCSSERKEEKGDNCPCGEPAKCNSCTICTCSEWEEDLIIGPKENPKGFQQQKVVKEKKGKKKSSCRCFQSSSDSKSSKSLEINDIYNCSFSKMQSEMSLATTSISSTVEDLITGDEKDKKKFCCLCSPQDDCQKFCELCLCAWEQKDRATNHKLYLDDYDRCDLCEICNQERFRGGMDLGMPSEEICKSFRESLSPVMNKLTPEPRNKIKHGDLDEHKEVPSLVEASKISKHLQIEELKLNLQLLKARNSDLQKWIQDRNHQIKFDPSMEKIPNHSKIRKEKINNEEMPRKDLAIGLFVLLVTFFSHLFRSNGIFSLSLLFRLLYQIIFFPYRTSFQIYKYLLILYDTLKECFIRNSVIGNHKLNIQLLLISIFAFFGLISIFLIIESETKSNDKFVKTRLKIIIRFVKKIIMLFLRPIIFLQILIKFVLYFSLKFFSNLTNLFFPRTLKNFSYRVMHSFINTFRIFFQRKFNLLSLNFTFIIIGFLINKMWNLSEVKIDLEFLRLFYSQYIPWETLKLVESPKFVDESIREEFYKPSGLFYFLNVTLQNIFECARLIFRSFEIK